MGGHFMFDDDQETPNTLSASFEFNDGGVKKMMEFEVRHWITNHEAGIMDNGSATVGATFYGSKGYLALWSEDDGKYYSFLGREQKPGPSGSDLGNHFGNFIDAVRSMGALLDPIHRKLLPYIVQEQPVLRIEHSGSPEITRFAQPGDEEPVEVCLIRIGLEFRQVGHQVHTRSCQRPRKVAPHAA